MFNNLGHNNRRNANTNWLGVLSTYYQVLRVMNRFINVRIRLFILISILASLLLYTLRNHSSNDTSILFVNQFDDNLMNLRKELQYAVMIDAGSSGSRVHIYVWPPHSGDTRQLLQIRMLHNELGKDVYKSIKPGLSSCASNPSSATNYISPLLKFATDNIPVEKHKETPLFILATAGMRLLPIETQNLILDNLRTNIPKNFSFHFSSNHVEVISGREEGIFSWIAVNYLLGRFDHTIETGPISTINFDNKLIKRAQTVSMLEMGGASVQIAYEVTSDKQLEQLKSSESEQTLKSVMSEFNLGCSEHDSDHNYRLYVKTYLGLGANVARSTYVHSLIAHTINDNTSLEKKEMTLLDPCLCIDSVDNITTARRTKNNNGSTTFMYRLKGTGDMASCEAKLKQMLDPNQETSKQCNSNFSCPLTQLRQTLAPFDSSEFFGFSELWYTMEDVLRMGGIYSYNKFHTSAQSYCATSWSVIQDRVDRGVYPLADSNRLFYQCFKSSWVTSILHDGFKMPKVYSKYRSASNVNKEQVQWTLGALLHRTRFFPLRAIERLSVNYSRSSSSYSYYINYILFIICMLVVVLCIVIYLRHLQRMVNNFNDNNSNNIKSGLMEIVIEKEPLIDSIR